MFSRNWKNREKDLLEGNEYFFPHQKFPEDKDPLDKASYDDYKGQTYSMDKMVEEALHFIERNKKLHAEPSVINVKANEI